MVVCMSLLQAPTLEVKVAWLTEIRKILTNQLKLQQGLRLLYLSAASVFTFLAHRPGFSLFNLDSALFRRPDCCELDLTTMCVPCLFSDEAPSLPLSDKLLSDR